MADFYHKRKSIKFIGANETQTDRFTIYPSPYMVFTNGGRYTKHIYIGSERIVSKVAIDNGYNPATTPTAAYGNNTYVTRLNNKSVALNDSVEAIYTKFQLPYNGLNNDNIIPGFQPSLMSLASTASSTDNYEDYSYYIHSDHLGSTSYITDSDGEVSQHVEYVPFGEVFIEELSSSAKLNTPFLFNGKELDEETGLYYYGARYYEPRTSLWLSTDPMELKYPNISTYTYCANNPIKLIDPQGTEAVYNLNGDYLGSTKEGFTGDILIHIGDEPIFDISNYSRTELQQKYSADIETLDDVRMWTVGSISKENQSKIWTHIASQFEGTFIYDKIFTLKSIKSEQIGYAPLEGAGWFTNLKTNNIYG
ncbi:MAG: hypothetical protein IJ342_08735, partial [Muribaculaceae bacterium]|nr:hypothetical protein [Muribaculaceae bacterium]